MPTGLIAQWPLMMGGLVGMRKREIVLDLEGLKECTIISSLLMKFR